RQTERISSATTICTTFTSPSICSAQLSSSASLNPRVISEFDVVREVHAELADAVLALGEPTLERLAPVPVHDFPEDCAALRFCAGVSWMYVAVWERGS